MRESKIGDFFWGSLGVSCFLIMLGFRGFQMVMGYIGIKENLGIIWAIVALACCLVFRFTVPIAVGTYFGVVDVLEWHWAIALSVAAPGLLFMVPAFVLAIISNSRRGW